MNISIPLGTSSDDNILTPVYKIQADPAGTLGATDGLAFSNDGSLLAVSDNLANAYLYRESDLTLQQQFNHTTIAYAGRHQSDGEINAIDFSVDDKLMLTGVNDNGTKVWDVETGSLLYHLNQGTNTDGAAFSPNGKWMAAAADGTVKIFDVQNDFVEIASIEASSDEVNTVDWSADSQFLALAADDGEPINQTGVQLYTTGENSNPEDNWQFVRDFDYPDTAKSARISPNNQYLAVSGRGPDGPDNTIPGLVLIYDLETGELVKDLPHQGNLVPQPLDDQDDRVFIEEVAWTQDGSYLFTSGLIDGVARIWRSQDWSLVGYVQGQETNRAIEKIDISPDGKVAFGGDEGTVSVYQFNAPEIFDPIQSDRSEDNLITLEVEDNDTNLAQGGFAWRDTTDAGASGGQAVQAIPTSDTTIDEIDTNFSTGDPLVDSPKLDFRVNFTETGTYYVWVRGREGFLSGDSVHIGLNGEEVATAERIDIDDTGWTWNNENRDDEAATLEIDQLGESTVNLFMREVGTSVDKILLTTNPDFDPNLVNHAWGSDASFRAESTRYEAEDAFFGEGVNVASNRLGFSGDGYVDFPRTTGDNVSLEWTVDVATDGEYFLDFAYANGRNRDRALELSVNDTVVDPSLSFGSTSGRSNWDMSSTTVNLEAGTNTIKLTADNNRGANIDYLELVAKPDTVV